MIHSAAQTLAGGRTRVFSEVYSAAQPEECGLLPSNLGYVVRKLEARKVPPDRTGHLATDRN